MTTRKTAILRSTLGLALVGAFALTSCATDEQAGFTDDDTTKTDGGKTTPAKQTDGSKNDRSDTTDGDYGDALVAEVDDPVEFAKCEEAEEMHDATVEWLDDVVVEEQRIEAVADQTVEIDGEQVTIPGMPELVIPEIVGQSGCVIEYAAPGGCLPAVEVSGSYVPGYRVPERKLPAVELPDGTVIEEEIQPAMESEPIKQEGKFQEQVCQTEPEAGESDYVAQVIRPHISRPYIMASYSMSSSINRSSEITESGASVPGEVVQTYQVPTITVHSAHVEADYLETYKVDGADHTDYAEDDQVISYTTEGDVLFDSDDHALRSEAEEELKAIADDIALRDDEYTVTVEGHTDDLPTQEYADNTELSEKRAESVVSWLHDNAGVSANDTLAKGLGDESPRSSNDSEEGRQDNRRVVITVKPVDHKPEIDYKVEGGGIEGQ